MLQHYWLEPAQPGTVLGTGDLQVQAFKRPPGTQEPAHFLDATIQLTAEDTIVIAAIDQVYPELRLAERIAAARTATRSVRVNPNVQERVQFRQVSAYVKEPPHSPASSLLQNDSFVAALRDLIEKFNG